MGLEGGKEGNSCLEYNFLPSPLNVEPGTRGGSSARSDRCYQNRFEPSERDWNWRTTFAIWRYLTLPSTASYVAVIWSGSLWSIWSKKIASENGFQLSRAKPSGPFGLNYGEHKENCPGLGQVTRDVDLLVHVSQPLPRSTAYFNPSIWPVGARLGVGDWSGTERIRNAFAAQNKSC